MIALALAALAATTIDVRVMTREHPTQLTISGPRHIDAALAKGALQVDGVATETPLALPAATWRIAVGRGPSRRYDGEITVAPDGRELAVVVRMDRERYVSLVVASETTPGTPSAALEAQAVVTRSWAAAVARRHGDADVCDLAHCQVMRRSLPFDHLDATRRAALATRGVVLELPDGTVAMSPYHASCGGQTADPRELFGGSDRTGAESVEDPGCDGPVWRALISRELVERAASDALRGDPSRGIPFSDLDTEAGRGGWIRVIVDKATGESAYGDAFARALGRSAGWNTIRGDRFRLTPAGTEHIAIDGVGLGHGVGLCQSGAARRARAGDDAFAILRHYFPRAAVTEAK